MSETNSQFNAMADTPSSKEENLDLEKTATTKTLTGARANAFTVFVVLTQLVQMIPYGVGINSGLSIASQLGASPDKGAWIAAAYPLTQGSFVLIGGTLGSVYGHKNLLALGSGWWVFWTLATGLMDNIVGMGIMRGLAGIGGGLMVPNAVALLGITFPPGKRRNLGTSI
jgi:MFS family permease